MSIPTIDSELVAFGANFDAKITLAPTSYSLTAAQALSFHTAYTAYLAAYNALATARESKARSKLLTDNRDDARDGLLKIGRELYGIVQDSNSVSDGLKEDLGITVRRVNPSVVPTPGTAPGIAVVATVNNIVTLRIYDANRPTKRAKPATAEGASLFSFVGATAPTDEGAWKFEGNVSRSVVSVPFPTATPPGAKVWFTAQWYNRRKDQGPAAAAVGTNLPGGAAMAA